MAANIDALRQNASRARRKRGDIPGERTVVRRRQRRCPCRNVPHFRSATMKTIKFEDVLKDYLEEMKRTGWYTKAYKAFVEANILKLVMERRPVADPNATHDGSVRRDRNDRDRPRGRGDDRGLHEVRDRTDGSRVLSPPEANLLRGPRATSSRGRRCRPRTIARSRARSHRNGIGLVQHAYGQTASRRWRKSMSRSRR